MNKLTTYLDQAALTGSEKEVIKKGYGLDKNGKRHSLTEVAVGLRLPRTQIPVAEAAALKKIRETTDAVEFLESKLERTSGEEDLLSALDALDPKEPKPFLFEEAYPELVKETDATVEVDTAEETSDSKGEKDAGGSNSEVDSGAGPDLHTDPERVGSGNVELSGEGEEGVDKQDGKADTTPTKVAPKTSKTVEVRMVVSDRINEFKDIVNNILSSGGNIRTDMAYSERIGQRANYAALVVTGGRWTNRTAPRMAETFVGSDPAEIAKQVEGYLNEKVRESLCFHLTSQYRTNTSKVEYCVMVTHLI